MSDRENQDREFIVFPSSGNAFAVRGSHLSVEQGCRCVILWGAEKKIVGTFPLENIRGVYAADALVRRESKE